MDCGIPRAVCLLYWVILTAGLLAPNGDRIAVACFGLGGYPDLSHLLAFAVLAVLVDWAGLAWSRKDLVGALVVYAIATEAAQCIIPGRTGNLVDGAANVAGIAAGLVVSYAVRTIVARRTIRS